MQYQSHGSPVPLSTSRAERASAADAPSESQLAEVGKQHGFSVEATTALWQALVAGRGGMAQFTHPEFGGRGQWMRGGMLMVGDMFNHDLKARVGALCDALAERAAEQPDVLASGSHAQTGAANAWWPDGLGQPATRGDQNGMRYAWFPQERRLAIERDGVLELYDTADHRIGGVSQQQGGTHDVQFSSQHGVVDLASLRRVEADTARAPERTGSSDAEGREAGEFQPPTDAGAPSSRQSNRDDSVPPSLVARSSADGEHGRLLDTIERLAALYERGVLSDEEYRAKKVELLERI